MRGYALAHLGIANELELPTPLELASE
jgi:hypothetical protein